MNKVGGGGGASGGLFDFVCLFGLESLSIYKCAHKIMPWCPIF